MRIIDVKGLSIESKEQLRELSELPSNEFDLFELIESDLDETESDFAYGLYENGKLVAHCSIGGADGVIEGCNYDDELLSDVFVHPDHRGHNYARILIAYAMNHGDHRNHNIYCEPINYTDSIYQKMGFKEIDDGLLAYKRKRRTGVHTHE